jgi:hypothetical protein
MEAEELTAFEEDAFREPLDFPDWLHDLEALEGEAPGPLVEEPPAAEGVAPASPEGSAIRPPGVEEVGGREEAERPDDQAELEGAEVPASLQDEPVSAPYEEARPESTESAPEEPISTTIEIPDWLKESLEPGAEAPPAERAPDEERFAVEQPAAVEAEAEEEAPQEEAPESYEIPGWFQEVEEAAEAMPSEELVTPVTEQPPEALETPAWLNELLAQAPGVTDEDSPPAAGTVFDEDEIGAGLARAEIPEWLEDLRPGDAEERAASKGPLETEGLLKGLRGLLPVSAALEAPSTYKGPATAMPSEASLARAELLQSLLSQPAARPEPQLRERKASVGTSVERWLVTGVLLLAVLGALLAPLMMREVPQLTQPVATSGALRLYEAVEGLGAGDEVLVAFDYGLPEADELDVVARPILEHVIDQDAGVSIVSTRPDGPLVAAALMGGIADSPDQYRQFGYRPGAATAASQLLAATDRPPTLLLVLTSRAAPLRRWVEQVRARYGDRLPVVLAGSAAIEPAASPFLDPGAGQLSGSIHGVRGAASYEALRGVGGEAEQRLNALAAGHLAIILLMTAGALFYGLQGSRGAEHDA